mmetsp:Transcript_49386/g.160054  ORF Transcript_49386/g.160054 Transcript_49386/m.160054 type:complete len:250 (+) Transcript_49386:658-1407(+)
MKSGFLPRGTLSCRHHQSSSASHTRGGHTPRRGRRAARAPRPRAPRRPRDAARPPSPGPACPRVRHAGPRMASPLAGWREASSPSGGHGVVGAPPHARRGRDDRHGPPLPALPLRRRLPPPGLATAPTRSGTRRKCNARPPRQPRPCRLRRCLAPAPPLRRRRPSAPPSASKPLPACRRHHAPQPPQPAGPWPTRPDLARPAGGRPAELRAGRTRGRATGRCGARHHGRRRRHPRQNGRRSAGRRARQR